MNLRNVFRQLLDVLELGDDDDSRERSRNGQRRDWDRHDDDDDERHFRRHDGRRRERDNDLFDIG